MHMEATNALQTTDDDYEVMKNTPDDVHDEVQNEKDENPMFANSTVTTTGDMQMPVGVYELDDDYMTTEDIQIT